MKGYTLRISSSTGAVRWAVHHYREANGNKALFHHNPPAVKLSLLDNHYEDLHLSIASLNAKMIIERGPNKACQHLMIILLRSCNCLSHWICLDMIYRRVSSIDAGRINSYHSGKHN